VLRAGKVGLRARDKADVAVLHAELYEDIATRMRADSRPWLPIPVGSAASPYAVSEPRDDTAAFSVVELAGGELAGEALLWAIDLHNRTAHLGVSLRPAFRVAAWALMRSWHCVSMVSPSVACTGCRSTPWPAPVKEVRRPR
jgi:hypothetical protein